MFMMSDVRGHHNLTPGKALTICALLVLQVVGTLEYSEWFE